MYVLVAAFHIMLPKLWMVYMQCFILQSTGELNMPPILPKKEGVCDYCGGTSFIQREDDKEEVVKRRLELYKNETEPLIEFYENLGVLVHLQRYVNTLYN